jgi:hypothetical protein
MSWIHLDKPALTDMIETVQTGDIAPLFTPVLSEGKWVSLPFYHQLRLYRLTSFSSMPIFSLHFLGDGTRFYYLDGTILPLLTTAQHGDLKITAGNIIAYLNFYFFAVIQAEGEVFLVHEPGEYPFLDQTPDQFQPTFHIGPGAPTYEITALDDGGFQVVTPLFIDGTLARATLLVDVMGRVTITEQRLILPGDLPPRPDAPIYH